MSETDKICSSDRVCRFFTLHHTQNLVLTLFSYIAQFGKLELSSQTITQTLVCLEKCRFGFFCSVAR